MSTVRNERGYDIDVQSTLEWNSEHLSICLNARVNLNDRKLEEIILDCITQVQYQFKVNVTIENISCFAPGRPNPTHRFGSFTAIEDKVKNEHIY